jgi:hypothetical protein
VDPEQVDTEPSALTEAQIEARKQQQKRVFDKIWSEVEKIMDEMRLRLESGLRNTNGKAVEEIEKNIEYVIFVLREIGTVS